MQGPSTRSARRGDALPTYLRELREQPMLSREEEQVLARRYVERDDQLAARRLVAANLRLVVKIAAEYRGAHHDLADLIQEGNLGLLHAVKRFDPTRNVKLSTYAAWWIRAFVLRFILANSRIVKLGTTQAQRRLFFNLQLEKTRLERLGFDPDAAMLARSLDVRVKDVVDMQQRLSSPDLSMDAPVGNGRDGEEGRSRADTVPSGEQPLDERLADAELSRLVRDKLAAFTEGLGPRDRIVIRERWQAERPTTLEKVAGQLGISRERVRQIEERLLDRFRRFMRAEIGRDFVQLGAA